VHRAATDVLNKGADDWTLRCSSADENWNVVATRPVHVILTKIDQTFPGTLSTD
jgi:hypothetical protein